MFSGLLYWMMMMSEEGTKLDVTTTRIKFKGINFYQVLCSLAILGYLSASS